MSAPYQWLNPMQAQVRMTLRTLIADKQADMERTELGWTLRWKLEDEICGAVHLARRLNCLTKAEAERILAGEPFFA
jgi:hypothetical protein